jgi:hypothetical protein
MSRQTHPSAPSEGADPGSNALGDFAASLAIIAWLVSIFHARSARKEYLMRLDVLQRSASQSEAQRDAELQRRIAEDYEANAKSTPQQQQRPATNETSRTQANRLRHEPVCVALANFPRT